MELGRSFRLQRGSSLKLGRSNRSLLISDSVSSECARITSYEKLSESMRLSHECNSNSNHRRKKYRAWGFLSKIFSFKKIDGDDEIEQGQLAVEDEEKKKKPSSSLSSKLPDPNRRWPVQGW